MEHLVNQSFCFLSLFPLIGIFHFLLIFFLHAVFIHWFESRIKLFNFGWIHLFYLFLLFFTWSLLLYFGIFFWIFWLKNIQLLSLWLRWMFLWLIGVGNCGYFLLVDGDESRKWFFFLEIHVNIIKFTIISRVLFGSNFSLLLLFQPFINKIFNFFCYFLRFCLAFINNTVILWRRNSYLIK